MEDVGIIELYFARSEAAVSETANKYGGLLTRIAYNILNNVSDSEEVVNDTYLAAWNTIPPRIPKVLKHFLSRITRNLSFKRFDYTNAAKRRGNADLMLSELSECIPDRRADMESALDAKRIGELINGYLGGISREDCAIFVLRFFYVESAAEISKKLSIPVRRVSYRLSVMRKQLRAVFEKEGFAI